MNVTTPHLLCPLTLLGAQRSYPRAPIACSALSAPFRPTRAITPWLLCLLALLFTAAPRASAQSDPVRVEAKAPDSAYVGDAVTLQIVVHGSKAATPPDISSISGLAIPPHYLGAQDQSSSFTMVVNGQVTSRNDTNVAYLYQLTPAKAGPLQIPAITVDIEGKKYTTDPLSILIVSPSTDADSQLALLSDATEAFVGQPIDITITWTLTKPIRGVRYTFPFDADAAEIVSPPDPRPPTSRRMSNNSPYAEVDFNNGKALAEIGTANVNGQQVQTVTVKQIVIPKRPGTLTLGPAQIDYQAVTGQRQRRIGDAPWDDLSILRRFSLTSSPVSINVSPLPSAGRPADFSGLVGKFSIFADARPNEVSIGEPIDLDISISGPQPLARVPAIDLRAQWGRDQRLRLPREPLLPSVDGSAAKFSASIRVRSDQVTQIPPIALSYFDPYERAYRTAKTNPIPIKVRPGTTIGADEPDDDSDATASVAESSVTPGLPEGMAAWDPVPPPLSTYPAWLDRISDWRSPLVLALCIAPPSLLLCAGLVATLSSRVHPHSPAKRRARAHRRARRALASPRANSPEVTARIFANYLIESLALPPGSTTPREALAVASPQLSPSDAADLELALWPADARFAPTGDPTASASVQSSRQLLDRIHRAWSHAEPPRSQSGGAA